MTAPVCFFKCLGVTLLLLFHSIAYTQTIEATVLQKQLADLEMPELQRFYSARDFQPVWLIEESTQFEAVLTFIANADAEGLDSRDYQLQELQRLHRQVE